MQRPKKPGREPERPPQGAGEAALKQLPTAAAAAAALKASLPALQSAANSPRKLAKTNTMPGPGAGSGAAAAHQLTAAERVKLRQQAAALGAVERLKQRKAYGPGAAQDRAGHHSHSGDTIPAVRPSGGGGTLPPIGAGAAVSPTACFSYTDSRRSSGVHHLSASPSFLDEEGARSRSLSPLGELLQNAREPSAGPPAGGAAPALAPERSLGLLQMLSPSRRASRLQAPTQLDETDLPLAALAAASSRRQTGAADIRATADRSSGPGEGLMPPEPQPELSAGDVVPRHSPAVPLQPLQPEARQAATGSAVEAVPAVAASAGADSQAAGSDNRASTSPQQQPGVAESPSAAPGAQLPSADGVAACDGSGAAAVSAKSPPHAQAVGQEEGAAGTAGADSLARVDVAEAQSPGRGILEKLAALKGLSSSRPASRTLGQQQLEGVEPAAGLPALHSQPSGGSARGPSRIQSLHQQQQQRHRDRSRLSVDGHLEQGSSLGRAHQLAHATSGLEAGPHGQGEAEGDALASFEQAALQSEQQRRATVADVPLEGGRQWRRSTPSSTSSASAGSEGARRAPQQRPASAPSGFTIPSCPAGRVLQIQIHSTWGDLHYLGLAGIEVFDAAGQPVAISDPKSQVSANPESINVLPEYGCDPRTPDKLVDGICMTCDDTHVWLCPFTPGAAHTVTITFDSAVTLGMLRIWNYNKNRIHSLRGARHVDITLDGGLVFTGELQQAPGNVAEALEHAEAILFTDDPAVLELIEQHDAKYLLEAGRRASPALPGSSGGGSSSGRAGWAQAVPDELDLVTGVQSPRAPASLAAGSSVLSRTVTGGRPLTAANLAAAQQLERLSSGEEASTSGRCGSAGPPLLRCRQLVLAVIDTYGDSHFCGLSGLEVVGPDGRPLALAPGALWADPPDLNVFPGHSGDVRTLDKLLDGVNNTMDDTHMWLAPIKRQLGASLKSEATHPAAAAVPEALRQYNLLVVTLGEEPVPILGLRAWNYNKSAADTARGIKRCIVLADGVEVSPPGGILLRKAPGTAALDFGQLIPLSTVWRQQAAGEAAARGPPAPPLPPAGRRRTTMQGGGGSGRLSPQLGKQGPAAGSAAAVAVWDETTAWVTNMPDPVMAAEYLQRSAAWRKNNTLHQPSESFATPLPCGFALKFVILTSWGDPHYVGLCGIEVHDAARGPLPTDPSQLLAVPASVALLAGMASDVRTPDKLVDGDNSGSAMHSWLAPLSPDEGNCVHITYDEPLLLGAIRIWNYAKTPARGVQELEVYLDDQLIFKGLLQKAPEALPPGTDFSQTLCFCEEAVQGEMRRRVAAAKQGVASSGQDSVADYLNHDSVVLVNDGQFVRSASGGSGRRGEGGGGALPPTLRPITAAC